MTAELIAKSLNGVRSGSRWLVRCPAHDDRNPSLSITDGSDGRILVKCFAGCEPRAIFAALKFRGLLSSSDRRRLHRSDKTVIKPNSNASDFALRIWQQAQSAAGSLVETYLKARAITMPVPSSLRYHPNLKHKSGLRLPAMVALVTDAVSGKPMAIHRTYLSSDGTKKANVPNNKMMLGPTRGSVVRLGGGVDGLLIGEGIETTLSVIQATGRPGWAALSTSGLKALQLPPDVKDVTIIADGDQAGTIAAKVAAKNWVREGRNVRIATAPDGFDFNDILRTVSTSNRSNAA